MGSARALRSRELRQAQTLAERRAWYLLRNRNVAGLKFRRQQAIDDYTVDFYCPDLRLALELGRCEKIDQLNTKAQRHQEGQQSDMPRCEARSPGALS